MPVSGTSPDPFDADGAAWNPVSPRLAVVRRVGALIGMLVVAALAAGAVRLFGLPSVVPGWAPGALAAGWLLWLVWDFWLIGRQVQAIGYAERPEELLVRSGRFYRRIVVVPYGRLQFVDVTAGPLARWLGFATVQLHTASPGSDAAIPGVPAAEAARLRDRLTERGQAQLAGL